MESKTFSLPHHFRAWPSVENLGEGDEPQNPFQVLLSMHYTVVRWITIFRANHRVIQTAIQGIGMIKMLARAPTKPRHKRPQPLPTKVTWFCPPSMLRHTQRSIATDAQAQPMIV